MKTRNCLFYVVLATLTCISCNNPASKKESEKRINPLFQLELKDSSQLIHIKNKFYKNSDGHLYERTFADREIVGVDSLVSVEYFNGQLPQDVDPISFEALDGWFAKDKNFAYYYRPTSGGMAIVKLKDADAKSFKVLAGHYLYAVDDEHVFKELDTLAGFNPATLKIIKNDAGKIVRLVSDSSSYSTE